MKKWQSKEEFKARVREWAKKIDVDVRVISIRVMKNKWASFAVGSRLLIFNTELLKMEKHSVTMSLSMNCFILPCRITVVSGKA